MASNGPLRRRTLSVYLQASQSADRESAYSVKLYWGVAVNDIFPPVRWTVGHNRLGRGYGSWSYLQLVFYCAPAECVPTLSKKKQKLFFAIAGHLLWHPCRAWAGLSQRGFDVFVQEQL